LLGHQDRHAHPKPGGRFRANRLKNVKKRLGEATLLRVRQGKKKKKASQPSRPEETGGKEPQKGREMTYQKKGKNQEKKSKECQ